MSSKLIAMIRAIETNPVDLPFMNPQEKKDKLKLIKEAVEKGEI